MFQLNYDVNFPGTHFRHVRKVMVALGAYGDPQFFRLGTGGSLQDTN